MENKPFKEIIALKLVKLREGMGLTQEEMSSKANLSRGQISMYEAAKRTPPLETLDHLADFFGVHIGYFIGDSGITTKEALRKEELNRLMADILNDTDTPEDLKDILIAKILKLKSEPPQT